MSQLDYLWTNYGSYSVTDSLETPDSIPTSEAIKRYVEDTEVGIVKLTYREIDKDRIEIIGIDRNGNEITSFTINKDVRVTQFDRYTLTQAEIDNGIVGEVGDKCLRVVLSNGVTFYATLKDFDYNGHETDTTITEVVDGVVSSNVKINNPTSERQVDIKTTTDGIYAKLVLNNDSQSNVKIQTTQNGVSTEFNWNNTETPIGFEIVNYSEYNLMEPKDGVVYFIPDKNIIALNRTLYPDVSRYTLKEDFNNLKEDVEDLQSKDFVEFVNVADKNLPNRKAIVLPTQGDVLLVTTEDGQTRSALQYNRWGIFDIGIPGKPFNINIAAGDRPTVQEEGQTGEEAYKIAYTSDLVNLATKEEVDQKINSVIDSAPEALDTLKELSEALNNDPDFAATITNKLTSIESELDKKVEYTDISTSENPDRKAIVLNNHDTLLGNATDGSTYNLIMMSKWDKVDVGTAQKEINLNGSAERPTYNDDSELALLKDIEDIKIPIEFNFPLRTIQDRVYTQEEIFAWFGVANAAELKSLIVREGQFYLKYGIQLSGNPYYYKMPIQYIAFESANQIKMVVIGLDTTNDMPTKYEIILNLDGTIAEGNSNIKITMTDLTATVPTKVSELENDSEYQTKSDVDARIEAIVGAAPDALDTLEEIASKLSDNDDVVAAMTSEISTKASQSELDSVKNDLSQFKSPYQVDLNKLNSASDSESISDAIGGIDNLRNVVSENRTVIGDINNGTVPVSIRILGNITTVYYVLDSLAGYTLNEINIQNTDGVLSKNSVTHSVMSEEMVVDNLTSSETTLPLSANQGRILDEKIKKNGMYYQGVKVDTQKLFALTKDSSEDEIKAALQMETSSGSYTLPTTKILDDCIGKGYMLNSNWMPVSVAWNGAAYVFYITGQTYMNQPASLAQVSIRIQDGVYSVFQAAKINKFALEGDIPENIATLSDGKHLNLPIDGSITAVQDNETGSTGVLLCQRTYDEGVSYVTEVGNVRNKMTLNSTERPQIDLPDSVSYKIAYQEDVENLKYKITGDLDIATYVEQGYHVQLLNKLEQSYLDDLGNPDNVNGIPYSTENQPLLGQPYLSFAKFDEDFNFHYDLFIINGQYNLGYLGVFFQTMKLNMDTYDSKLNSLEQKIQALESSNN